MRHCKYGILFLVNLVLFSYSVGAETTCHDMYAGAILDDNCIPVNGTCPSTCTDYLAKLHTVCEGGNTDEETPYTLGSLLFLYLEIDFGVCEDVLYDFLISDDRTFSCSDYLALSSVATVFSCDASEPHCSSFCKGIIDKIYDTCSADDTMMHEKAIMTAQETEYETRKYRSHRCNKYADQKLFKGSVERQKKCRHMFNGAMLPTRKVEYSNGCMPVDGACPSSCDDYLDTMHNTCKGSTFVDETPYTPGRLLDLSMIADFGVCEEVLNEFLVSDDRRFSCSDYLHLSSVAAVFSCGTTEPKCSDFCRGVIDKVYETCSALDTTIDMEDGETVTAQDVEDSLYDLRHEECNIYVDTKSFKSIRSSKKGDEEEGSGGVWRWTKELLITIRDFVVGLVE